MFDLFDGLPVHPLVLHAVVVLAPLLAILALLYAFVPRVRLGLRWPLAVLSVLVIAFGYVTKESGEVLEHRLEAQGENDPTALTLVHDHAEAGDLAFIACARSACRSATASSPSEKRTAVPRASCAGQPLARMLARS